MNKKCLTNTQWKKKDLLQLYELFYDLNSSSTLNNTMPLLDCTKKEWKETKTTKKKKKNKNENNNYI